MRITDEHLAHWRRHGYVVVPELLTAAELAGEALAEGRARELAGTVPAVQ